MGAQKGGEGREKEGLDASEIGKGRLEIGANRA